MSFVYCNKCEGELSDSLRYCPTCSTDVGFPNVRESNKLENREALAKRFRKSKKIANLNGCLSEFNKLHKRLRDVSGVVIAMPANFLLNLLTNKSSIYRNYPDLVGDGKRKPAELEDDKLRSAVGGILFGSYADKICYGALSMTNYGLTTYGTVHCRLKDIAIQDRTTFLEDNSFKFVDDNCIGAKIDMPKGYTAEWKYRHLLVLSKIAHNLKKGQTNYDLQNLILYSDGQDRSKDIFIEAHIFGSFDRDAIKTVKPNKSVKLDKSEKTLVDIVMEKFYN